MNLKLFISTPVALWGVRALINKGISNNQSISWLSTWKHSMKLVTQCSIQFYKYFHISHFLQPLCLSHPMSASSWSDSRMSTSSHWPLLTITAHLPFLNPPAVTRFFSGGSFFHPKIHVQNDSDRKSHRFVLSFNSLCPKSIDLSCILICFTQLNVNYFTLESL